MNKRNLLICGLLALGVTSTAVALVGCNAPEEEVPDIKETVRYSEETNPYAELTWQEIATIDDWGKKLTEAPISYQFEGSYSEAYQGNYHRDYLYMNCYEDGSLHATYGANSNYYGYWTNVDRRGNQDLVLHVLNYNGSEYNSGIYDLVCDEANSEYYDFASNIHNPLNGGRTVTISGYRYSPVKSLEVTTSDQSSGCIIGDDMNYTGLVVKVNRENGKSIAIDEESYKDSTCRVKFEGFDSSEAGDIDIKVSYVNTEISTTYKVKVVGVTAIELNTTKVIKEFNVGDKINTDGLIINATRDDGVVAVLGVDKCEEKCSGEAGESVPVTISFQGIEESYNVKIKPVVLNGELDNGNKITVKLVSLTDCEYTVGGKTYRLNYSKSNVSGTTYCMLSKPESADIPAAVWEEINTNYVILAAEGAIKVSKMIAYSIPDSGDGDTPGTPRYENEPMLGIGGGTEQRTLVIDSAAGTATISYKYWYAGHTDTFVCKYTLENGVLTLTEEISKQVGGSGAQFQNLHKVWTLQSDGTALRTPFVSG